MSPRSPRPGAVIIAVVVLVVAVKFLVLDAAVVDGRSMLPLFKPGSVILVFRSSYGIKNPFGPGYLARWAAPRPGDVVAAANPRDGRVLVKRVAAVGPAELAVAAERLVGPSVDAFLGRERAAALGTRLLVPEGSVYLLGDNQLESVDSREYGPLPIDLVYGRVLAPRARAAP